MKLDVSGAEAAGELCRVPVCIGCHRPATGSGRIRLRNAPASPGVDAEAGPLGLVVIGLALFKRPASDEARIQYPACWRHRWLNRPSLRLERATGDRVVLDGVSAEFVAGWEATRATRAGSAEPAATADPSHTPAV